MKNILRFLLGSALMTWLAVSTDGLTGLWTEKVAFGDGPTSPRVEAQPLKVVVISQPLTYRRLAALETGYEYDLLHHFALDAGYRLHVKVVKNRQEMLQHLAQNKADVAAARWTAAEVQNQRFLSGPAYDEEKLSLICRQNVETNFTFTGNLDRHNSFRLLINGDVMNSQATHHWIEVLKARAPRIQVSNRKGLSTAAIFRQIEQAKVDCTVADRLEAHYYLRFFPKLAVVKDISPTRSYHFLISNKRADLQNQMRVWFTKAARKQTLSTTKSFYKEKIQELSRYDVVQFLKARDKVLPQYSSTFKKHSREFGIPWQLAAAVAYQESHWKADAESFTGVKGLMQLTMETAEHLGVEDRTDANQSIWGGSKYLKMLIERQPKGIPFKERLSLALATYNVGPAHMIDAQKLALRLGKDPYSWKDLKTVLPLLGNAAYLDELKYGAARGQEPVDFVHRVLAYLDLISVKI